MPSRYQITLGGTTFSANQGDVLLDAALRNGVNLPHDCRAGHCGACCVRLVTGKVDGGEGNTPGIVHACQCRIAGDATFERREAPAIRTVGGILSSLRALSSEVMEVGITTHRAIPYLAGQYVKVQFDGYPDRPFSISHALSGRQTARTIWFHIRRMENGRVSPALGNRIRLGHHVTLTGPYGEAHFRPELPGRLILIATNTGFAPIWSIAAAALRERPDRAMLIIVGGRTLDSLYMGPALGQLARFPNVMIVPVCSRSQNLPPAIMRGRPTDVLPVMHPSDVIYACGAAAMIESVKAAASRAGALCYADPFLPATSDTPADSVLTRAIGWLQLPASQSKRPGTPARTASTDAKRVLTEPALRQSVGP